MKLAHLTRLEDFGTRSLVVHVSTDSRRSTALDRHRGHRHRCAHYCDDRVPHRAGCVLRRIPDPNGHEEKTVHGRRRRRRTVRERLIGNRMAILEDPLLTSVSLVPRRVSFSLRIDVTEVFRRRRILDGQRRG